MSLSESFSTFYPSLIKSSFRSANSYDHINKLARLSSCSDFQSIWHHIQSKRIHHSQSISTLSENGLLIYPDMIDTSDWDWLYNLIKSACISSNKHDLSSFLSHLDIQNSIIKGLPRKLFYVLSLDAGAPLFVDVVSLVFNSRSMLNSNSVLWHRDRDSPNFRKIFIYLTDTFEGEGHHEFCLKSHLLPSGILDNGFFSDSDLASQLNTFQLPLENVKITGRAGTLFLENTRGLHRGTNIYSPHSIRLMLSLTLSSTPLSYSNSRPIYIKSLCDRINSNIYSLV